MPSRVLGTGTSRQIKLGAGRGFKEGGGSLNCTLTHFTCLCTSPFTACSMKLQWTSLHSFNHPPSPAFRRCDGVQGSCLQGSELDASVPTWEMLVNEALRWGDRQGSAESPGTKHPARSSTRGRVLQACAGRRAHTHAAPEQSSSPLHPPSSVGQERFPPGRVQPGKMQ